LADENLLVLASLIEQDMPDGRFDAHLDSHFHIIARSAGKMRRTPDCVVHDDRDPDELPIASRPFASHLFSGHQFASPWVANLPSAAHAAFMRADAQPRSPIAHTYQIYARQYSRDKDLMHFRSHLVVKSLNPNIFKAPHLRLASSDRAQTGATLSRRDLRQIVADMID